MEDQLAEYRKKKQKERQSQQSLFQRVFSKGQSESPSNNPTGPTTNLSQSSNTAGARPSETDGLTPDDRNQSTDTPQLVQSVQALEHFYDDWKSYLPLCLKVLLWFLLWKFFIEIGFGAVYFIVSCSYLMYRNTRTGPKEKNRLSAYSVFNPNHERLDGTFTAEQFEKELRFGPGSVH